MDNKDPQCEKMFESTRAKWDDMPSRERNILSVHRYFFFAGMQVAEKTLRDAVLDVIDDGCNCDSGEKHPWEFYGDESGAPEAFTEDMANQQRLRFCDAVVARVRAIVGFDAQKDQGIRLDSGGGF